MNKELFWGMVASGKCSQFEQLSPEDQQAVREVSPEHLRMLSRLSQAWQSNCKDNIQSQDREG